MDDYYAEHDVHLDEPVHRYLQHGEYSYPAHITTEAGQLRERRRVNRRAANYFYSDGARDLQATHRQVPRPPEGTQTRGESKHSQGAT